MNLEEVFSIRMKTKDLNMLKVVSEQFEIPPTIFARQIILMSIKEYRRTNQLLVPALKVKYRRFHDAITAESVSANKILDWASKNAGGKLDTYTLFEVFKSQITQVALKDLLKSMEGQTYKVRGSYYYICAGAGRRARYMTRVTKK